MRASDLLFVEEMVYEALPLRDAERARLLDTQCVGQPLLRAEIESLLAAHDAAGPGALRAHVLGTVAALELGRGHSGQTIAGFRLLDCIGYGGMGVVYRAEREGASTSPVALKLPWTPRGHRETIRRFLVERQVLGRLHHPHIVSLVEGGVTDDGLAYLVMEHVEGVSITQYSTAHQQSIHARLMLFIELCGAVRYMHEHSVAHGDLKPGNILVTADGVLKVLDFGLARLTPSCGPALTREPQLGDWLTPAYASPEQLYGAGATTLSDVYSLGVTLYELLSGRRPYETRGQCREEVRRLVLECQPPLPHPLRAWEDELNVITRTAMHWNPAWRYASVRALSDAIRRALPVPPDAAIGQGHKRNVRSDTGG